jgi:hypothetical protein
MYTINVCYGLLAIFMVICALFPEHLFKGLHPDQHALYAFASLSVFVWIVLIYITTLEVWKP